MDRFIGITGTTGVGKSRVAVLLAKKLGAEVISADSMQIYKGMDIGTAKITPAEQESVVHRMLDIVEPNCDYSSFLYGEAAAEYINNAAIPPVVVGGTGFYFDSLLFPPEFGNVDSARRDELNTLLAENGLEYLANYLKKIDKKTYDVIDLKNPKRVIRAIEIAESGLKKSDGLGNNRKPRFDARIFVLQTDREQLYSKIDARVDDMFANGLVQEVQALVNKYGFLQTSAFQAIGYKEVIAYLKGDITLTKAIELVKINTRHYAKRQISYFKRMNVFEFVDVEKFASPEGVVEYLYEKISDYI